MNVLRKQNKTDVIVKSKKQFHNTKAKMAGLASVLALALPQMASAAASDPGALVGDIIDVVVDIFPFIGAFFIVSGAFKLFLAYRNDQPESQTAAAKDLVIGAVFVVFRVFVWDAIKGSVGL